MCPAGVSGVCVSGIFYQGNKFDFCFSQGSVAVEVTAQAGPWAPLLEAELWPSQARLPLPPGRQPPQTHPRVQGMSHVGPGGWVQVPEAVLHLRVQESCQRARVCALTHRVPTRPTGHKVYFPYSAGRIQRSLP